MQSLMLRVSFVMVLMAITAPVADADEQAMAWRVGVAEIDITPPVGFPMAGYYHERLADGMLDPLQARAIVFRDRATAAALVVCDLVGIATDLSHAIRRRASEKTGIPASNIVISATHSHTAPDYMRELFLYLGQEPQDRGRAEYIEKLIQGPVDAIASADARVMPVALSAGAATQRTSVSFNRRFVMRDGSVRTWMTYANPEVVRAAGPIDPEIGLLLITGVDRQPRAILSNFALHLDTVGGTKWSADYPVFIERTLRQSLGAELTSIFAIGCCGDINHSDPSRRDRNKTDFIGNSIGESIIGGLSQLKPIHPGSLFVKSEKVQLPLQEVSRPEVERSAEILKLAKQQTKVDFFDQVTAYKTIMLDQFLRSEPYAKTSEYLAWGLSRLLTGVGKSLPVEVTVMTMGQDLAMVYLPGEVFVELGLAIKQASPFRTTLVVELANCVETCYIPHRAASVGGSYEVLNSTLQPGSGEVLVETALRLLRDAAVYSQGNRK
jgi:neutral ceramidase